MYTENNYHFTLEHGEVHVYYLSTEVAGGCFVAKDESHLTIYDTFLDLEHIFSKSSGGIIS